MEITRTCPMFGTTTTVEVKDEDYKKYLNGEKVQYAFPYLSKQDREGIISGYCYEAQELIFGE